MSCATYESDAAVPQQMFHRNAPQQIINRGPHRVAHPERLLMGIANLDRRLIVRQANQDFITQFHQPTYAIYGRSIYDLIDPSAHGQIQQNFSNLVNGNANRFGCRGIALVPRERARNCELTGAVVRDETNRVAGITVLVRLEPHQNADPDPTVEQVSISKIDAQILEGIAVGASTMELAGQLHLSRQGVEYHVSAMLRKLGATNRTALVSRAHSMGLLRLDIWPPVAVAETIR